jgi:DNA-binding GntR family transcriptional regulator
MSLLPVMEALVRLKFEGLVESRPRAGTRVRIPTREDVIGHFVVREALEGQAANLFAAQATGTERSSLQKLAARTDRLFKADQVQFAYWHQKFHVRVVEGAHCPTLVRAIESTQALQSTWLVVLVPRLSTSSLGFKDHQNLAKFLLGGTPQQAEVQMRQHVRRGFHQIMDGLEPYFELRRLRGETYSRTTQTSYAATQARTFSA